jgi:hypothetical protein
VLAKEVEHTVDVDGMLDRMTPKQFAEWCIMHKIWDEQSKAEDKPEPLENSLEVMRRMAGV